MYGEKKDNTIIFNDLVINDAKKGYCTLELTNQMLAVEGMSELELVIFEGEKRLSTMPFILNVVGSKYSEDAIASTNEFTALSNALKTVGEIDNKADKKEVEKISSQLDNIALSKTNWINVVENGVDNSGLKDVTIKLQDLIDSYEGYVIYLPKGIYLISQIKLPKGTTLLGDGINSTILKGTSATDMVVLKDYYLLMLK